MKRIIGFLILVVIFSLCTNVAVRTAFAQENPSPAVKAAQDKFNAAQKEFEKADAKLKALQAALNNPQQRESPSSTVGEIPLDDGTPKKPTQKQIDDATRKKNEAKDARDKAQTELDACKEADKHKGDGSGEGKSGKGKGDHGDQGHEGEEGEGGDWASNHLPKHGGEKITSNQILLQGPFSVGTSTLGTSVPLQPLGGGVMSVAGNEGVGGNVQVGGTPTGPAGATGATGQTGGAQTFANPSTPFTQADVSSINAMAGGVLTEVQGACKKNCPPTPTPNSSSSVK